MRKMIELGKHFQNSPPTSSASELPKKFWETRDAAVEHVLSNSLLPSGLGELQEWLATDGWDDLLAAWINEDVALNLKDWATYELTDSSLRDTEGLEASVDITDQMRVDYARSAISNAIEQCDGCDSPSIHSFPIQRDDGERAILGCTVEIHGQSGPVQKWHGVFAGEEAFYRYLRESGFLLHSEADKIGDAEILLLWQVEKKKNKSKNKSSK